MAAHPAWIGDDHPAGWRRVGKIDLGDPADTKAALAKGYRIGSAYDDGSDPAGEPCAADIYEKTEDRMMKCTYHIMRPGKPRETRKHEFKNAPDYRQLKDLLTPLLDGAPLEHVYVLYEGRRADMFVDEMGHVRNVPLPRNEEATAIYRANALKRGMASDPEDLPWIAGPAILFEEIVWS